MDKITNISAWNSFAVRDAYTFTLYRNNLILLLIVVRFLPSTFKLVVYIYSEKRNKKMISLIKKYNLNLLRKLIFAISIVLSFAISILYLNAGQAFI